MFSAAFRGHAESRCLEASTCRVAAANPNSGAGLGSSSASILRNVVEPCGAEQTLSQRAVTSNFGPDTPKASALEVSHFVAAKASHQQGGDRETFGQRDEPPAAVGTRPLLLFPGAGLSVTL